MTRGNPKAVRLRASKVLAKARLGPDRGAEKRAAAGKLTGNIGDLIEGFMEDREPHWRPRYYAEVARQLQNDWKPLHKHDVAAIARADVLARIEAIATAQGDIAADRARTALGGLY